MEFVTIIQGEDRTLSLRVANSDSTPFDLSDATQITARFRKQDGSVLEKNMPDVAVTDSHAGKLTVGLASADTATLLHGQRQDFSLVIERPSGKRKVNFKRAISVEKEVV